jgi:hypothetical protein
MKDEALKLALEYLEDSDNYLGSIDNSKPIAAIKQALAAKRQWVGLTIGEIQDLIQFKEHSPFALAEDIEAKLKEKNT